jgi:hypothetical protein
VFCLVFFLSVGPNKDYKDFKGMSRIIYLNFLKRLLRKGIFFDKKGSYLLPRQKAAHYLELVDLLSSAGVSSRLNVPRSAVLAGVDVAGLLFILFRLEEEERKLDSVNHIKTIKSELT